MAAALLLLDAVASSALWPRVVLPADYRLGVGLTGASGALSVASLGLAAPLALTLGAVGLLLVNRARVARFVFDDEALEIMTERENGELVPTGPNFAVGGQNRWRYDQIKEWQFFPTADLPALLFFREASGQAHLFPALADPAELRRMFAERVGADRESSESFPDLR
eukprot:scaffold172430_cov34-Tisochrysis_lutea.AAC.2